MLQIVRPISVFTGLAFSTATPLWAQDGTAELVQAAENMPRGVLEIPAQWFEMESVVGWEKMMLVFGYADNRTVCSRLVEMAYVDSPDREFRCSAAN